MRATIVSRRALTLAIPVLLGLVAARTSHAQGEPSDAAKKAAKKQEERDRERDAKEDREAAETARTRTPIAPGAGAHLATASVPGGLVFPTAPGSPTPYNCLEWAFCTRNCWTQPCTSPPCPPSWAVTLAQLLAARGFDITKPVDCKSSTAKHVIMLIWFVPESTPDVPGSIPSDDTWVHAMKRLDGTWSSKNGSAGFHDHISDPEGFLDRHYPPPPGKKRIVRCFEHS